MVTIVRGREKKVVTNGAFKAFFKSEGWEVADEAEQAETEQEDLNEQEVEDDPEDDEDTEEEEFDNDEEDEDSEDDEVDLDSMSKKELREYAAELKIDLTDVEDKKAALIEAIRSYEQ